MKTFSINTLGCKVNQYESQQIRELLEQFGLKQVDTPDTADLAVINTCCVTHTASAKSRQYIRKAQRAGSGHIIVSGCLPSGQLGELSDNQPENTHILWQRDELAATLSRIASGSTANENSKSPQICQPSSIKAKDSSKIKHKFTECPKLPQLTSFKGNTRAFLKVQDGCDGYCSYCIIPKTRPHVHSKTPEAVLKEAQALVKAGHKEIIVTGIFLGAYGQTTVKRKNWANQKNDKLAELLDRIAQIPNLKRIRLSSLEPSDITAKLLDVFCKHRNIMPHLHLSLQSGSDTLLKKMCRQYNADEFMRTVELIKTRLDSPAITADFIVGFPGETDADFEQTAELAGKIALAGMHVFSFSPRKGTAAVAMQAQIDRTVIKERAKALRDLGIELSRRFRRQFIGQIDTVLVEKNNGRASGRSKRYFMVYLQKAENNFSNNELVKARLVGNSKDGMVGKAVI